MQAEQGKEVERLFIVKHRRVLWDDVYETKSIGWYSSRAKATDAVERSKVLEGFRDYPEGYATVEIEVDRIHEVDEVDCSDDQRRRSKATTVYEVGYARELSNDVTDVKFIGIFSTRRKADEALETVRKLPPFSVFPDCLYVMEVEVDIDHWTFGFFTPEG